MSLEGNAGGKIQHDPDYQQYYQQYHQKYQQQIQRPQARPAAQTPRGQRPAPPRRRPPKRRGGVGRVIAIAILFILLFVVIANRDTIMDLMGPGTQYREYPKEVEYTITRTVSMSGSNYQLADMRVPVPENIVSLGGTYIQQVHNSSHQEPNEVQFNETAESDMWGNGNSRDRVWWEWTMANQVSGSLRIVKSHHITSKTVRWNLDQDKTGTVTDISSSNDPAVVNLKNKYLGEEWKIKPDHPAIQAVAEEVQKGTNGNAYLIVRNTYLLLDNQFTYQTGVQLEPKDPEDTLSSLRGDCDDQSILMASILRACGIPAWLEIGGLYDRNVGEWGGHAWLKVWIPMLDGNGYFDPSSSGSVDIDVVNDEFLFRSCYRYAEWESDGNGSHLQEYYMFVSYFGSPTITISWDNVELDKSGTERYLTSEGEVAAPGFEALAAIAALAVIGITLRRKKTR